MRDGRGTQSVRDDRGTRGTRGAWGGIAAFAKPGQGPSHSAANSTQSAANSACAGPNSTRIATGVAHACRDGVVLQPEAPRLSAFG